MLTHGVHLNWVYNRDLRGKVLATANQHLAYNSRSSQITGRPHAARPSFAWPSCLLADQHQLSEPRSFQRHIAKGKNLKCPQAAHCRMHRNVSMLKLHEQEGLAHGPMHRLVPWLQDTSLGFVFVDSCIIHFTIKPFKPETLKVYRRSGRCKRTPGSMFIKVNHDFSHRDGLALIRKLSVFHIRSRWLSQRIRWISLPSL